MAHVTIFGAGASREYRERTTASPFPLDGTFLSDMERVWSDWGRGHGTPTPGHHHYDGNEWDWPSLKERILDATGGAALDDVGFEEAFLAVADVDPTWEDRFCRGIELVLFWKLRGDKPEDVPVHTEYVKRHVRPGDTVITFNYDPLIEISLTGLSGNDHLTWHPQDGYGLTFDGVLRHGIGLESIERGASSNVELLKLHGSVNWLVPATEWPSRPRYLLRLLDESFRGPGHILIKDQDVVYRPVFVPPRQSKEYEQFGLGQLWHRASKAIRDAESITMIGYSFPETDVAARELVIDAARRSDQLERIVLVSPDTAAAERLQAAIPDLQVADCTFGEYMRELVPREGRAGGREESAGTS